MMNPKDTLFDTDRLRGMPDELIQILSDVDQIPYDYLQWKESDFEYEMDTLFPKHGCRVWLN